MSDDIKKIIEIDAPAEVVFNALIDPKELTQWFPDKAVFEPRVGEKMHLTFFPTQNRNKESILNGEVIEFVPNKKLSYTFVPVESCAPGMPQDIKIKPTIVTWNIEEISKNKSRLTLTHSGFTKELDEMHKKTTAGWSYFVGRLEEYLKKKSINS
jgi:uncharacterized protein YndB with AHSA1/START domain